MPTNLYGQNDNFHPENSHVISTMMRRFHEAKEADASEVVWASGQPMREFLHVDDMPAASVFVMNLDDATYQANDQAMLSHLNLGIGLNCTIRELAEILAEVTGYNDKLVFDTNKPDSAPSKLIDVSRLNVSGWEATTSLESGLMSTDQWFLEYQELLHG